MSADQRRGYRAGVADTEGKFAGWVSPDSHERVMAERDAALQEAAVHKQGKEEMFTELESVYPTRRMRSMPDRSESTSSVPTSPLRTSQGE